MFRLPWRAERRAARPDPEAPLRDRPGSDAEAVLRRLEWTVIRRLDGVLHGDYRTFLRGFGMDLADLREYRPEDDARHIDWNVTARLGVPHVREFHEDREMAAWFLVDLSGSVDFGSGSVRKRALAVEFVAVLARLLTRRGNRVGALLYRGGVGPVVPVRAGRRHVLHLLDRLLAVPAGPEHGAETDLAGLLDSALHTIGRHSAVFVISDFISASAWSRPLASLSRRHDVVAVRLFDPLELALPDLGLVFMQDAETGEQLLVDTHDRGFRERFASAATEREGRLRGAFTAAGVDGLELATDGRLDEALLRFVRYRSGQARIAAGRRHAHHVHAHVAARPGTTP
ncbi:MAG: hypothetical protein IOMNBAOH_01226 [Rhodocyclaceae bacterium]|nr:hypothetical protein [Rhodocyclaceae bacterium]